MYFYVYTFVVTTIPSNIEMYSSCIHSLLSIAVLYLHSECLQI
jgi:hypothetical protein